MANLNFQQAPRSLASGGVGGRVGSGLVGGVSGHVTPTFGGALSPGRGSTAMPGGAPPSMASRATLFGQRAFADRRVPMPTSLSQPNSNAMSSMSNLSRFNTGNNYHSVFGEGGDTSTPPLLDLSEFPSLTARGAGDQAPAAAPPPPGSKPYVGMVKQPTSEQSEFTMSSEDFPALPGTSSGAGASAALAAGAAGAAGAVGVASAAGVAAPAPHHAHLLHAPADLNHTDSKQRKGIQTSPEGDVLQIAAAAELYNREWRYHMEEKVWISQAPGMPMVEKTSTYERGTYYFFDAHNWRKVAKEFHLDYSKLEGRPQLPPHVLT